MTRVLSLPTEHREVAAAVDSIAAQIAESTVRAAAPEEVGGGGGCAFAGSRRRNSVLRRHGPV
jgi:hypothetical protein